MNDPVILVTLASASVAATGLFSVAALTAWRGWLGLKRDALAVTPGIQDREIGRDREVDSLKERIRRLEAIAAGIEL